MARTAKITLDGVEYTVHAFNLGELEEATAAFDGPQSRVPYTVLRIALRRAEPKVNGSVEELSPTVDEITDAFLAIAELSGISVKKTELKPPA